MKTKKLSFSNEVEVHVYNLSMDEIKMKKRHWKYIRKYVKKFAKRNSAYKNECKEKRKVIDAFRAKKLTLLNRFYDPNFHLRIKKQ